MAQRFLRAQIVCALTLVAVPASAQNYSGPGQSWSGSWGFQSPSDRSIALQQAQAIRSARNPTPGPTTVITNSYDNRSSYQEIVGTGGPVGDIQFQIGDAIGQNTNAIGAMNTGTTNIDIAGSGNTITATNAADSEGCIDGSVQAENVAVPGELVGTGGQSVSMTSGGRSTTCRSR
jgi:hypothetical protein